MISDAAEHYLALAQRLAREELPVGTAWREVEHYREKLVANKEYQWINFREQKVRPGWQQASGYGSGECWNSLSHASCLADF